MKQYSGIIVTIFGALLLILSFFLDWVDYNLVQTTGALLVIAGIVVHVIVNKKTSKSPQ